jgi:uncharacterized protein YfiM (DUF2279 family)
VETRRTRRTLLGRGRELSFRRAILAISIFVGVTSAAGAQTHDSTAAVAMKPPPHDSFLGLDKPKHFLISFFIESSSFAAIQAAGADRRRAMTGASLITSGFAVGREIHDRSEKGLFSIGDLLWDALGAGTAIVMLRHTYR